MRRNPLIFKQEEYKFLHTVYLREPQRSRVYFSIKRKNGIGLAKSEIIYVKRKFEEWKASHHNELLWMEN